MTNHLLDAALDYAARGWQVVPIKPGEKRPSINEWTKKATADGDLLAAWWRSHPTHGVGIATGPRSGIWVLDVDGDTGKDTLKRLEAEHGELPHTYTVATGSGGLHYYWRWVPGLDVRNDASKRLGPCLDVRGDGGQVVAPPTTHPNGTAYRWTHGDEPVDAPGWLLDLLRPVDALSDRPDNGVAERVRERPLDRTDGTARPGDRFNDTTTWEQLLEADGWTHHHTDRSGEVHWTRPGKDRREGSSATTGHQGADVLHVFTSGVAGLDTEQNYSRFAYYTATRHAGNYNDAARALSSVQDAAALDQWLARTATAIIEREPMPEAAEVANEAQAESLVDTIRSKFLRGDAIEQLPPVEWLIDGVLERRSVANLYGPSGIGKSFLALDLAASIVTGRSWHGHPTAGGTVLYIAAEGAAGQGPRRRAWMTHYGTSSLDGLIWYPEAINLTSAIEVQALTDAALDLAPDLIVFDTQARCSVGAEENSAKDMGLIVAACDRIVAAFDCTVLLIHHSGKDAGAGLRGSTAVLGAMNTVLAASHAGDGLTLTIEKQKNAEDGAKHSFQLVPSADSVVAIEVSRGVSGMTNETASLLAAIEDLDEGNGASLSDLVCATGIPKTTANRYLKQAVRSALCHKGGTEARPRYTVSEQGKQGLAWGNVPQRSTEVDQ